MSIVTEWAL